MAKRRRQRRGFGRLRKLPSGRWQAAYVGPDARLHKAPRTFAAEIDAEGWLASQRRKIDLGTWGAAESSDGITLASYAARWMAQRQLRPTSAAKYHSLLERLILPELGLIRLAAITPALVRGWHAGLDGAHPHQNTDAYKLLHAIFATAVADEVLEASPCRLRGLPASAKRDVDVLSPSQIDALAAGMPERWRASVAVTAWCGLRLGELTELRRKDVADGASVLRIRRAVVFLSGEFIVGPPKTSAGARDVGVPPHIRPILLAHMATHVGKSGDALLFSDDDGRHLRDRYHDAFSRARAAVGRPHLRVHDLRHIGAVYAAQSGATTIELMHRLGHTTPSMALRYQHVAEGRDAEIAQRLSKLAEGQPQ